MLSGNLRRDNSHLIAENYHTPVPTENSSLWTQAACKEAMKDSPQHSTSRAPGRPCGFTLIEVLVVVGIVALLIAILMPSLSGAREQARSAVCMSNLRQVGLGLATYTTEMRDWLAGPNTSGKAQAYSSYTFTQSQTEPTQNMDWISPTLGRQLGLPLDRDQRMVRILNNDLKCPTNNITYDGLFSGGGESGMSVNVDPHAVNYSSYSAMLGFHLKQDYDHMGNRTSFQGPIFAPSEMTAAVSVPEHYRFRIDAVGRLSTKIYVTEGARYVSNDLSNPQVTFNPFVKQIRGGNFMDLGPNFRRINGTPYRREADLRLTPSARRFSYRHRDRMNAVFFDGHCEGLRDQASLKVSMYFPKGTVIVNAAATADPNDETGQVID